MTSTLDRDLLGSDVNTSKSTERRAGRILVIVSVAIVGVMAGQVLVGAHKIGISNDHATHVDRLQTWFQTGWYVPDGYIDPATDQPRPERENHKHTYGAAFSILAHGLNAATGIEVWGEPSMDSGAFLGRSLAIGILGIVAAATVGMSVHAMTGSRVIALWSSAALLAIPAWSGYSMFAIKDIPTATGWTMLSAGLTLALVPETRRWKRPLTILILCLFGTWLSFGVRTALWVIIATSLATFAVLAAASLTRGRLGPNVISVGAGVLGGLLGVSLLHYRNASTLLDWLSTAVRNSLGYQWTGYTLTAGDLVSQNPPWWYLPRWVFHSLPLLIAVLAVGGLILVVGNTARSAEPSKPIRGRLGKTEAAALLWVHQALLIPIAAAARDATMYGGLRQHIYVLPPLIVLAGMAVWKTQNVVERGRLFQVTLVAVLITAITLPVVAQTGLFPYNYVYKNSLTRPVWGEWETDLHWTSRREALTRVPADASAFYYVAPTQTASGEWDIPSLRVAEGSNALGPFLHEQGLHISEPASRDGLWVVARPYSGTPPPPGCVEYDNVSRPLRGEQVILSYVLVCNRDHLG